MSFRVALAMSCSAVALVAQPALAQGGPPQTAANDSANNASAVVPNENASLSEIVVTANKREENLQKTPIAVVAVTPDAISRAGVKDFTNINKIAPDIQVGNVVGSAQISVRGIRQYALGPTDETPIAVHLDNVYLSRSTGLQGLFYDVQRIEVLKGPQGTLYGRNATGGAINIITNRPGPTFGAQGEAEFGNYGLYRLEAAINAPVSDQLWLRFAGRRYRHNGYFANGLDDADQSGARAEALATLTRRAKLFVSADYELSDRNGPGVGLIGVAPTYNGGVTGRAPAVVVPDDPFKDTSLLYPQGRRAANERQEIYGAQAQFDYDLDFATLTAQAGYRGANGHQNSVTTATTTAGQAFQISPFASHTFSSEVRLASNATMPLQWVAGVFYFTEHESGALCAVPTADAPANFDYRSNCLIFVGLPFQRNRSYAVFGQATYTPPSIDKLHLTLGLRKNWDKKEAVDQELSPALRINEYFPDLHNSYEATTYRVGASYDLTPRSMLYADMSTGYKAGGFDYGSQPEFFPEQMTAYEIGSKNRFFDNRLQINVDLYHYIYKNTTQNVTVLPPPGLPVPFVDLTVATVGKIHVDGVSLQTEFLVTSDDRLSANVEYNEPKFVNFVIPPRFASTPPLNLQGVPTGGTAGVYTGSRPFNAPRWSGNAAYDHTFRLDHSTLDAQVAMQWAGQTHMALAQPGTLQDVVRGAYTRFDLSLRYAPASGLWNVTGYVNNVGDARTIANASYSNSSGLITGGFFAPRTFGITFGAKY